MLYYGSILSNARFDHRASTGQLTQIRTFSGVIPRISGDPVAQWAVEVRQRAEEPPPGHAGHPARFAAELRPGHSTRVQMKATKPTTVHTAVLPRLRQMPKVASCPAYLHILEH